MPRPNYPARPGTPLFPTMWEQYHRPTAELQFTATCVIRQPPSAAMATFDEVSGRSVYPTPAVLYSGACRVQAEPAPPRGEETVGGRPVARYRYRVGLPAATTGLVVGATVAITVAAQNPVLTSRTLWITALPSGSITWQTDVLCSDEAPVVR